MSEYDLLKSQHEHHDRLEHLFKEHLELMSTISDDLSALTTALTDLVTDDTSLRAQVKTLTDENATLTAQLAAVDPKAQAELAAAQAQIESLTTQVNALLHPTPPPAPLAVTSGTVTGTAGTALAAVIQATGGTTPFTFTVTGLPDGLAADALGNVTGTPTAAGSTDAQVSVTDAGTPPQTATGTLTVVVS